MEFFEIKKMMVPVVLAPSIRFIILG